MKIFLATTAPPTGSTATVQTTSVSTIAPSHPICTKAIPSGLATNKVAAISVGYVLNVGLTMSTDLGFIVQSTAQSVFPVVIAEPDRISSYIIVPVRESRLLPRKEIFSNEMKYLFDLF